MHTGAAEHPPAGKFKQNVHFQVTLITINNLHERASVIKNYLSTFSDENLS
jgi:hypothetical protein